MKKILSELINNHFLVGLLLFIFSFFLYSNTLFHQFTLDDVLVLTKNKYVTTADYWAIFSKDTFAGFFTSSESTQLVPGGRYRPLTLAIFATIWPITQAPWFFHLINVLVYATTVLTLFYFLLTLPLKKTIPTSHSSFACLTTLIFAIHPIHTEVVNNIKGLDDILSLLLAILAWKTCHKPIFKNTLYNALTMMFLMLLALLAKESVVVFIPIAVISVWFFNKQSLMKVCITISPMVLALIIYLSLRLSTLSSNIDVTTLPELMNDPFIFWNGDQWLPLPWQEHFATVLHVLLLYLGKILFPMTLSHDYYPYAIDVTNFKTWTVWCSLLVHISLVIYTIHGLSKRQLPAFAIAIYLIALSLFANIFFNIGTLMAERFLFIPSLGFSIAMAWICLYSLNKVKNHLAIYIPLQLFLVMMILLAIFQTLNRAPAWKNNLTLFETDIKTSPNSAKLNNALGGELTKVSQEIPIKNSKSESAYLYRAIDYVKRASQLHPTYAMPHLTQGNALHFLGQHDQAIESYDRAIQLKPNYQEAKENRTKVKAYLTELNKKQEQQDKEQQAIDLSMAGEHEKAIYIFNQLINEVSSSKLLFFRGVAYAQSKKYSQALNDFEAAELLADPNNHQNMVRIWQALVSTYQHLNQNQKAEEYKQKIIALNSK
ncbi:MAG: tetratricopeptide repeat protein [Marinicella sp.]|nr:tetratricopeptide repeat protein [Xanthomonadales bacterium]